MAALHVLSPEISQLQDKPKGRSEGSFVTVDDIQPKIKGIFKRLPPRRLPVAGLPYFFQHQLRQTIPPTLPALFWLPRQNLLHLLPHRRALVNLVVHFFV